MESATVVVAVAVDSEFAKIPLSAKHVMSEILAAICLSTRVRCVTYPFYSNFLYDIRMMTAVLCRRILLPGTGLNKKWFQKNSLGNSANFDGGVFLDVRSGSTAVVF